jgi:hypothetical protein
MASKEQRKIRSENCPDLDNQESCAEGNETFDKKLSLYI